MMPRALIVGGTGMTGRATARHLLAAGWQVHLTGRNPDHLLLDAVGAGYRVGYEDASQFSRETVTTRSAFTVGRRTAGAPGLNRRCLPRAANAGR